MDDAQVEWLRTLVGSAAEPGRHPGLYRAVVVDGAAADPLGAGRRLVQVPELSGQPLWAATCRNGTGEPPEVGRAAWIMFERGDPAYPVLVGEAP